MAYDKVFPVPLEAHDGSCSVFAEVLDEKRNTFGLLLFGFRPGEQVRAKSEQAPTEAACGLISEALSINRDGRYSLKIVHCGPPASSVFSVSAADCQVTLTYDYGLRPETTR